VTAGSDVSLVPVDPREVANRLTDRGASQECPACGESLQVIGDGAYVLLANPPGARVKGLDLAALVCENCGCVRLHATRALEADGPPTQPD
jgi:hypothetical protein